MVGKKEEEKEERKKRTIITKKCISNPNRQGRGRKKKTWKLTENPK